MIISLEISIDKHTHCVYCLIMNTTTDQLIAQIQKNLSQLKALERVTINRRLKLVIKTLGGK